MKHAAAPLLLACGLLSCARHDDLDPVVTNGAPTAPLVTDTASQLLFSFVDDDGRMQSVPRVDAVPEESRAHVLVVDLEASAEERQAHRYAFFADLTGRRADGTYPVSVVSRYDVAHAAAVAQDGGAVVELPGNASVIVYSAAWCGFCKKAKAWLTKNGVPFVERDVEKTAGAQAELAAKLRASHALKGGIPVIDWQGQLVIGFDEPRLERLRTKLPVQATPPTTAEGGR